MSKPKEMPSTDYLKTRFTYNEKTGQCFWKNHKNRTDLNGKPVATKRDKDGYICVQLDSKRYYMHRIIYKMHHDCEPEFIDHIDGDPMNNRVENLRSATIAENNKNRKKDGRNKSGFTGVFFHKQQNRYHANIRIDGKSIHIGSFEDIEDAIKARIEYQKQLGFSKRHGK